MLSANKNLKDTENKSVKDTFSIPAPYQADGFGLGSYTKTHKLITALYMVTDIIDKEEPIRNKLRILGTEIISDMHSVPAQAGNRIAETVSFLNIASAMNFISEMNCTILKKEFLELKGSIQEYIDMKPTWLSEFFDQGFPPISPNSHPSPLLSKERGNSFSKGHTGLGVQKGSTLMRAIKDMSNRVPAPYQAGGFGSGYDRTHPMSNSRDFDILKTQRRDNIINIIKNNGGNATIKDIRSKTNTGINGSLVCSEKTLQRELVSMIKDGVLNKTGEKRWSRYFIK